MINCHSNIKYLSFVCGTLDQVRVDAPERLQRAPAPRPPGRPLRRLRRPDHAARQRRVPAAARARVRHQAGQLPAAAHLRGAGARRPMPAAEHRGHSPCQIGWCPTVARVAG